MRWHQSLAARFGLVFVGFVVVGSLLLLGWLRHRQHQESQGVFLALARTDADFVRRLNLPRSAKLAEDLRQLLGMRIYFRDASGKMEPADASPALQALPVAEGVQIIPPDTQVSVVRLDDRHDILFARPTPPLSLSWRNSATRYALLTFWALSGALGWIIARQVLGPIGSLTRRLSGFLTSNTVPPEADRQDEIGLLARSLTAARDELVRERLMRERSERLALLGRVATGLAHEIKNPLASIRLHSQLIDAASLDEESRSSLTHIASESQVIEGLVNQWLYLARPQPPQRNRLDVKSVLEQTIEATRAQASHANVELRLQAAPDTLFECLGDRSRLQQGFRNILLNGIQAMPHGGQLQITMHLDPATSEMQLRFQDGGPGFSAEALRHGADLFYSEKEGGMGVGLNVVSEIISAHNGKMMLKNDPSGGAVVELRLPASTGQRSSVVLPP